MKNERFLRFVKRMADENLSEENKFCQKLYLHYQKINELGVKNYLDSLDEAKREEFFVDAIKINYLRYENLKKQYENDSHILENRIKKELIKDIFKYYSRLEENHEANFFFDFSENYFTFKFRLILFIVGIVFLLGAYILKNYEVFNTATSFITGGFGVILMITAFGNVFRD